MDGNGRTARALEALLLQRTGLRDMLFIAMSNYYYEEKNDYLRSLAEVRQREHDLTPFLLFGLSGIERQCNRLFKEIRVHVSKALYRNLMFDLFGRLRTTRKRVIAERHIGILKLLLERDHTLKQVVEKTYSHYSGLKNPTKALIRDINYLIQLGAISVRGLEGGGYEFSVRLEWPMEITETDFYERVKKMPKARTHTFLA